MGELRRALNAAIREHARQRVLARLSEVEQDAFESAAVVRGGQARTAEQEPALTAHLQAVGVEVEAVRAQLARTAGQAS